MTSSRATLAIFALAALTSAALAGGVTGEWARIDGKARVRFESCGAAMCGFITWVKDASGPAKVGQKVFFDMKDAGPGKWTGSAFNPEDGGTYSGKLTLNGDALNTAGCVLGGLVCKSVDLEARALRPNVLGSGMDRQDVLARLRENERALRERGVTHAALFGSVARGEQRPDSDIDIMVEIAPEARIDLFAYVGIVQFIEALFPVPVDVANRAGLKRMVRPGAERDAVYAF